LSACNLSGYRRDEPSGVVIGSTSSTKRINWIPSLTLPAVTSTASGWPSRSTKT
jgi:hypothetical protein